MATSTVCAVLSRLRAQPAVTARAARAPEPLLPPTPRRADPHRHQEAGPVRPARPTGATGRQAGYRRSGASRHGWDYVPRLPSTTPAGSRTSRSSTTRRAPTCVGVPASGHRLVRRHSGVTVASGHDRQRLPLPLQGPRRPRSPSSGSSTSAPGPTGPAPTAKPNASSRPSRANGPTPPATKTTSTDAAHSGPGSSTTTTDDPTAPSATRPPASHSSATDERPWDLQLGSSTSRPVQPVVPSSSPA